MSKQKTSVHTGIDTSGALGIVFVILKLTGVISWSWWWVTLPFWGGLVLFILFIIILIPIYLFSK